MGKRKGRGGGGPVEDQYGEAFVSQDREERPSFASKSGRSGMGGGGEAGGSKRSGQVSFSRHVPKFLQGHMHLLGRKPPGHEDDPAAAINNAVESDDDDNREDEDEAAAMRRAVAEDPTLAADHPELHDTLKKGRAVEAKELGNRAFAAKNFEEALQHFNTCIQLDPGNEVYFSNRAAALTSLRRFPAAVADSKKVIQLRPKWVKGYSRLAAAHFGNEDFSEAREAYEKALELEPDDQQLQDMRHKADVQERRQAEERRHKFKSKAPNTAKRRKGPHVKPGSGSAGPVSFDDEEED
ncbi:hypothetical protein WJX74_009774 [Apatococcus lobatus]|uniref:Uncharacterized protein n=2 Tax=Apatococcus TaxID=904362 RepID=A0AAW1SGE4_9CHLO